MANSSCFRRSIITFCLKILTFPLKKFPVNVSQRKSAFQLSSQRGWIIWFIWHVWMINQVRKKCIFDSLSLQWVFCFPWLLRNFSWIWDLHCRRKSRRDLINAARLALLLLKCWHFISHRGSMRSIFTIKCLRS